MRNHPKLSVIGHMTENPDEKIMVTKDGQDVELRAQGWDALKGEK
jgi:thiamine-monophosphate kinase